MKRIVMTVAVLTALVGGGWVAAQTPPTPKSTPTSPAPKSGADYGMMGGGMMGGGMMGGGLCPMLGAANAKVDVKKIDKGVTITMTSSDPATATRLQKMAEAMRLMHEAMTQ
jgi:predicted lipid-binding transport protein (Tim44 family)